MRVGAKSSAAASRGTFDAALQGRGGVGCVMGRSQVQRRMVMGVGLGFLGEHQDADGTVSLVCAAGSG